MISIYYLFEQKVDAQLSIDDVELFLRKTGGKDILISPKLDGVRCLISISRQKVAYYSRNHKEIPNFSVFDEEVQEIADELIKKYKLKYPIILDGEAASTDKKISSIMTQLRRIKNIDTSKLRLFLFDIVLKNTPFKTRHEMIKFGVNSAKTRLIKRLPYVPFKFNYNELDKKVNEFVKKGFEGAVLGHANSTYKSGRSSFSLKVKPYKSIDVPIVDVVRGTKGHTYEGLVIKLIVNYKGKHIPVAGRLDKQTRLEFSKNPPIGQCAEIKYNEITKDGMLRFPVFVRLREDKFCR